MINECYFVITNHDALSCWYDKISYKFDFEGQKNCVYSIIKS